MIGRPNTGISAHIAHLKAMSGLKVGDRVVSRTRPDGPALAHGRIARRAGVHRDGWIVEWDNGTRGRMAVANLYYEKD